MAKKETKIEKILVIKLSALGDFAQAFAAFKLIRDYHFDAEITLLTTPPYVELAQQSPYFDEIWDGGHAQGYAETLQLTSKIRKAKFFRIYDLQTSKRTNLYFRLLGPLRPEWSGIARGCSHPHKNKDRAKMHTVDRQAEQLAMAGVGLGRGRVGGAAPPPELSWAEEVQKGAARTELTWFGVRKPYALLVPGNAPDSREKRWPAENFGNLAMRLRRSGILPVIMGTESEQEEAYIIQRVCPGALSLIRRTDHLQIITLARQAAFAVGIDTGPMHLIASANCPSAVLFSAESSPELCAPRGADVTIIQKDVLEELSVGELWETLLSTGKLEPTLTPFQASGQNPPPTPKA